MPSALCLCLLGFSESQAHSLGTSGPCLGSPGGMKARRSPEMPQLEEVLSHVPHHLANNDHRRGDNKGITRLMSGNRLCVCKGDHSFGANV